MAILKNSHIRRGVHHMATIIRFAVIAVVLVVAGLVIYRVRSGDAGAV